MTFVERLEEINVKIAYLRRRVRLDSLILGVDEA